MPMWCPQGAVFHAKGATTTWTDDQLRELLKRYDANGDGRISKQELKRAFKDLGLWFSDWRAQRALHHADLDGDGFISDDELNILVSYASGKWGFTIN
ncbi:EF-hand domain [Dillenia turbinata]|uniref:EF-hand domain n=1 Tax=Dillenia turbinata TaxID=194707 RepID=A0AAN8VVU6_9MAGN